MRIVAIALALSIASCAHPLVGIAERGDYKSLQSKLAEHQARGDLSNADAADIAKAVADRELSQAKGQDRLKRVDEAYACASSLTSALRKVGNERDAAAAHALYMLYEQEELSRSDAREFLDSRDPEFRRVGTVTLTDAEDGILRRKRFVDSSPIVRRAALRAAIEAKDALDESALLDVARIDPDASSRSLAVRALGLLSKHRTDLSSQLKDLWDGADEPLREDIATVWLLVPMVQFGGREFLRDLLGSGKGRAAIGVAGLAIRARRDDAEIVAMSTSLLASAIAMGTTRDRLYAIARSPGDLPLMVEALLAASRDADQEIAIAAWGRLLYSSAHRSKAVTALESIASRKNALGRKARGELASVRHLAIQRWIEEDLVAQDSYVRIEASRQLASLGRSARGAALLADPFPHVRMQAACILLRAPH